VRLDLVDGLAQGRVFEDLDVARPIGDEEGVPRGIPAEPGRPRAPRELAGDLEGLSKSIAGGEEVERKLFKSAIEQDRLRGSVMRVSTPTLTSTKDTWPLSSPMAMASPLGRQAARSALPEVDTLPTDVPLLTSQSRTLLSEDAVARRFALFGSQQQPWIPPAL